MGDATGNIVAAMPNDFLCPITHEVLRDPVLTVDGQTYERAAIENCGV